MSKDFIPIVHDRQVESFIQDITQEDATEDVLPASPTNGHRLPGSKKQQDAQCAVCGDKATGSHYRAKTCEGCKVRLNK